MLNIGNHPIAKKNEEKYGFDEKINKDIPFFNVGKSQQWKTQLNSTQKNLIENKFKDEMVLQDMLIETLTEFYLDRTKMDKTQVKAYLKRDSWFNSEKCIELGLTDEVI